RPEIENIRKGESRPRSTVESLVLAQAQSRQILNLPTTIRVNRICMRLLLFYLSVFAARHFYTVPTNCFVLCLVRRTCSIASIQRGAGLYRSKQAARLTCGSMSSALVRAAEIKLKTMDWPTKQSLLLR